MLFLAVGVLLSQNGGSRRKGLRLGVSSLGVILNKASHDGVEGLGLVIHRALRTAASAEGVKENNMKVVSRKDNVLRCNVDVGVVVGQNSLARKTVKNLTVDFVTRLEAVSKGRNGVRLGEQPKRRQG